MIRAVTYLKQLFFLLSTCSSTIVTSFRGKLLPTSYFLRISSSLGQLVFPNNYHLGRQICSEYRYLQKSFFFEADTFTKHQIFLNSCFSSSATFNVTFTFSGELLFQISFFLKSATFPQFNISQGVRFHSFTPFHSYTSYLSISY